MDNTQKAIVLAIIAIAVGWILLDNGKKEAESSSTKMAEQANKIFETGGIK